LWQARIEWGTLIKFTTLEMTMTTTTTTTTTALQSDNDVLPTLQAGSKYLSDIAMPVPFSTTTTTTATSASVALSLTRSHHAVSVIGFISAISAAGVGNNAVKGISKTWQRWP